MTRPNQLDGFGGPDARASRIARRSEPMILWSSRGSRSDATVGRPIDSVRQHFVLKLYVIGHDRSRQVLVHSFQCLKNQIDFMVFIMDKYLNIIHYKFPQWMRWELT